MVYLCSEFGLEFSMTYNTTKTKCMKFELKPVMPETYPIRLKGNVLDWIISIKHVGNYFRNDLSESDKIRHKQCDFIGRFNGLLARYQERSYLTYISEVVILGCLYYWGPKSSMEYLQAFGQIIFPWLLLMPSSLLQFTYSKKRLHKLTGLTLTPPCVMQK